MPPKRTNMKTRKPTGKNSGSTSALAPSSDISSATLEPKSKLPKFKKKLADPPAAPPDPTPIMEHGTHSDIAKALIESGQDSSLLGDAEQSFAKIMAYCEIVRIEDTLAEV
ncbi:hypothetical protein BS47DRAFT_1393842 [Hydnum rufescens UP504]|uniref:Uncharacterized protein n=1 Tax=Hydnum rufescens UP504 TaxID=1448309 RepID=A0A9P6DVL6_9AGAM|nr:hypothetical protein BS47DRAFT_1393842 [Hydnum rufescens UP504]